MLEHPPPEGHCSECGEKMCPGDAEVELTNIPLGTQLHFHGRCAAPAWLAETQDPEEWSCRTVGTVPVLQTPPPQGHCCECGDRIPASESEVILTDRKYGAQLHFHGNCALAAYVAAV